MILCRQRSKTAFVGVIAAVVSFVAVQSARAQVLQQVPSDAVVVFKINHLRATSDKIAKFAEALGLAAMSPEVADPLGSLKEHLKIKEGLDETGEAAFVFTREALDKQDPEEGMMFLLPVSDYKAFLGNFTDVKTEEGVSSFKDPEGGSDVYAANWGKYAACANKKETLSHKPAGLKLTGLAAKEAVEKDAFLFANIPVLAEKALPELKKGREEGVKQIDKEFGANADAKPFIGVAKAAWGQIINVAEGFLKDSTSASIGFRLNDEGLATTLVTDFKPGSYAGNLAMELKNSKEPLMLGLPTGRKFFAAGGVVNDPQVSIKIISDLLDPISKELAKTDAGKSFADGIEGWKTLAGATKSAAFGYPMPSGALGADSILQSVMVVHGDSKAITEGQHKMLQAMADVMKMMPKDKGAEMNFEMTPNAKTVGDLKLDSYEYKFALDENNPKAAQMQQVMAFIYGPNGMGGTFGPIDKDTAIVVQGGTDKLLADAVKGAKDNKDEISDLAQVKRVAGQLPGNRLMVEYIFLDNLITAGVKYAQGFGLPIKMQLPPNLPPIGVSAATEGTAMRFDSFLPTQLVQSVVAAGMQTYMQMQGGGNGGGNGL